MEAWEGHTICGEDDACNGGRNFLCQHVHSVECDFSRLGLACQAMGALEDHAWLQDHTLQKYVVSYEFFHKTGVKLLSHFCVCCNFELIVKDDLWLYNWNKALTLADFSLQRELGRHFMYDTVRELAFIFEF